MYRYRAERQADLWNFVKGAISGALAAIVVISSGSLLFFALSH